MPPNRIADKDRAVRIPIGRFGIGKRHLLLKAGIIVFLYHPAAFIPVVQVRFRIGLDRLEFPQVPVNRFRNGLGHRTGMPGTGEIHYQHLAALLHAGGSAFRFGPRRRRFLRFP